MLIPERPWTCSCPRSTFWVFHSVPRLVSQRLAQSVHQKPLSLDHIHKLSIVAKRSLCFLIVPCRTIEKTLKKHESTLHRRPRVGASDLNTTMSAREQHRIDPTCHAFETSQNSRTRILKKKHDVRARKRSSTRIWYLPSQLLATNQMLICTHTYMFTKMQYEQKQQGNKETHGCNFYTQARKVGARTFAMLMLMRCKPVRLD